MEIYPSEYQQLELNRYEKIFVRHASNDENYGLVLLKINPAMLSGEYLHAVIMSCVQRSWTTLAGVSPVTVIASEPCS